MFRLFAGLARSTSLLTSHAQKSLTRHIRHLPSWRIQSHPSITTALTKNLQSLYKNSESEHYFQKGIRCIHEGNEQSGYNFWVLAFGPQQTPKYLHFENILNKCKELQISLDEADFTLLVIHSQQIAQIDFLFHSMARRHFSNATNTEILKCLLKNVDSLNDMKDLYRWLKEHDIASETICLKLARNIKHLPELYETIRYADYYTKDSTIPGKVRSHKMVEFTLDTGTIYLLPHDALRIKGVKETNSLFKSDTESKKHDVSPHAVCPRPRKI